MNYSKLIIFDELVLMDYFKAVSYSIFNRISSTVYFLEKCFRYIFHFFKEKPFGNVHKNKFNFGVTKRSESF